MGSTAVVGSEKKILGEKIMKNTLYIQLKIIDLKKEDEKNIEYLNAFTTEKKINDFMSWKDINEIKEFSEEEKKMFHDNTYVVYRDGIMDISILLLENNFIKQIEVITKSISYVVAKLAMLGSFIEGTMDLDKRQDEKLEQIGICLSESCKEKIEKKKLEYLKMHENRLWINWLKYALDGKNSSVFLPPIKNNIQDKINSYTSDQVLKGKYKLLMKELEEHE